MASVPLSPDLASLPSVFSFGKICCTWPPSLVPHPYLRIGFQARRRLRCQRSTGVQLLRQCPVIPFSTAVVHGIPMIFCNEPFFYGHENHH
uniref:Uncharacterized protein n=1 Tax=Triticum urartu TaxID=4572 RepID=A0A8R7R2R5_TRIUA